MSDNVVRPPGWAKNGSDDGGDGSDLRPRVTVLEADMRDVRAGIADINVTLKTMAVTLATLPTMADLVTTNGEIKVLSSRIEAQSDRLKRVEDSVLDTVKIGLSKSIGPLQLPAIIVSTAVALGLLAVGYAWLEKQPWFLH